VFALILRFYTEFRKLAVILLIYVKVVEDRSKLFDTHTLSDYQE